MKLLLVTEKYSPLPSQRDGGARLVNSLLEAFGEQVTVMQFGGEKNSTSFFHFSYPHENSNRFLRRMANASFMGEQIQNVQEHFTHICFIHISMQFGLITHPLNEEKEVWTFPMFLTPSYRASGEEVPLDYQNLEQEALRYSDYILTPSYFEEKQLIEEYKVPKKRIHVVPRGVDVNNLKPLTRHLDGSMPRFCSVGSIKRQKNTLGLISLFAEIKKRYPDATLRLIGPVQDKDYEREVKEAIEVHGLSQAIEMTGYISPEAMGEAIKDCQLHLSTSCCETFGRAVFETLGAGLPNVVKKTNHAAADFLSHLPYIYFTDDEKEMVCQVDYLLKNLSSLSLMAQEVGQLYDDKTLSSLVGAKIKGEPCIGISDFDGTLYHKKDEEATRYSMNEFRKFPCRVICSARPVYDLIDKLRLYSLEVDWIIGYSGCVIANGKGEVVQKYVLTPQDLVLLKKQFRETKEVQFEGEVLQLQTSAIEKLPLGFRCESYQGETFLFSWETSKLKAIQWLLRHIKWQGQVRAFGDGPYDREFLTYFNGRGVYGDVL